MANAHSDKTSRRSFLYYGTGMLGAAGAAFAAWPFIDQMNPSADVRALATIEVDLSPILEGQSITVLWQGKPVFIRRRTKAEIEEAEAVPLDDLPDPEADADRVQKPEWLITQGSCTHLGCVPLANSGEFDGWYCPCHGSHYDVSGRIRKGPAPLNLPIPPYEFLQDTLIRIG